MWGSHGGSCSPGISLDLSIQGLGFRDVGPGFMGLSLWPFRDPRLRRCLFKMSPPVAWVRFDSVMSDIGGVGGY